MWLASVDGAIAPREEARIPVCDEGLLRGDGGFEVLRVYGGTPFAWDDHLARLGRTCAGLRLAADLDALAGEARALLEAAAEPDALLRLVVTRGGRRIAIVEPLPRYGTTARVATITYAPTRVLNGLKTLSYAGNMLAVRLAQEQGCDEALLVTPHGRVLEGPTWTFFWVAAGRLHTPSLDDGILDSITRRRLLESCAVTEAAVHARRRPRRRGGVHRLDRARGHADRVRGRHRAPGRARARSPRPRGPRCRAASRAELAAAAPA